MTDRLLKWPLRLKYIEYGFFRAAFAFESVWARSRLPMKTRDGTPFSSGILITRENENHTK